MSYEVNCIFLSTKKNKCFLLSVNISELSKLFQLVKFHQVTIFSNVILTLKKSFNFAIIFSGLNHLQNVSGEMLNFTQ